MAATVVLVHGAWHGAWCWDRVVPGLEAAGLDVVAIDLPGHGDDPGPLTDMHGDADRVRSVLDGIDGPIVLVGHSYGGAVITDAGDHPAVRELVFLCALVLDEGEDAGSVFAGAPMPEPIEASELAAGMRFDETGTVATIDPAAAHACLYQDCEPADVEWASARLSPQPMATMQQPPRGVAWRSRPSTYVVAAEDRAIPPALQRWLATRCTVSVEWPTGHSPFLSDPDLVVGLLTQVASR